MVFHLLVRKYSCKSSLQVWFIAFVMCWLFKSFICISQAFPSPQEWNCTKETFYQPILMNWGEASQNLNPGLPPTPCPHTGSEKSCKTRVTDSYTATFCSVHWHPVKCQWWAQDRPGALWLPSPRVTLGPGKWSAPPPSKRYWCRAPVAHAYNPSYFGCRSITVRSQPRQTVCETLSWKKPIIKKDWWNNSKCRTWAQTPVPKNKTKTQGSGAE
jgi:hypothetical protein